MRRAPRAVGHDCDDRPSLAEALGHRRRDCRTPEAQAQTIASGDRHVPGKTVFPAFVRYLVNDITMFPLHLLQLATRRHPDALVLCCEMQRDTLPKPL